MSMIKTQRIFLDCDFYRSHEKINWTNYWSISMFDDHELCKVFNMSMSSCDLGLKPKLHHTLNVEFPNYWCLFEFVYLKNTNSNIINADVLLIDKIKKHKNLDTPINMM